MASNRGRHSRELTEQQFSLAAVLGVVSGLCVAFGASRVVGWWFLIFAAIPAAAGGGVLTFVALQRCLWAFWDLIGVLAEEPWQGRQFSERLPEFLMKKSEVQNDRR